MQDDVVIETLTDHRSLSRAPPTAAVYAMHRCLALQCFLIVIVDRRPELIGMIRPLPLLPSAVDTAQKCIAYSGDGISNCPSYHRIRDAHDEAEP